MPLNFLAEIKNQISFINNQVIKVKLTMVDSHNLNLNRTSPFGSNIIMIITILV